MSCPCLDKKPQVYKPRRPDKTALHKLIRLNYKRWIASKEEAVPLHIQREFHSYLQCGISANGFAYGMCKSCGQEFFVGLSCKGRAVCPSCNQKNMVEVAKHLGDEVLPDIAIRQWVVSFPKRLRCFLEDHRTLQSVLHIIVDEIKKILTHALPNISEAEFGAISFIHRFGNTLNYHPHFHILVADGLFAKRDAQSDDRQLQFFEAVLTSGIELTGEAIYRRVLKLMQRKKLLSKEAVHEMLGFEHTGFSLDATVKIERWDRAGRERLIRYCARPPFASENLRLQGGLVLYRLPKPTHDGRRQIQLSPLDFIERISRFVPLPYRHRRHYHGVFASASTMRELVVKAAPKQKRFSEKLNPAVTLTCEIAQKWRELIRYIYEVDPLTCSRCGGKIILQGFVTAPSSIRTILAGLGWPTERAEFAKAIDFYKAGALLVKDQHGQLVPYTEKLDLVALEYREHLRKETLWQEKTHTIEAHPSTHDPPAGALFIDQIDSPHFEEFIDPPFYEESMIFYD